MKSKTFSQHWFNRSSNQTKAPLYLAGSDHTYLSADGARVSFVTAKQTEAEIEEFQRLKALNIQEGTSDKLQLPNNYNSIGKMTPQRLAES